MWVENPSRITHHHHGLVLRNLCQFLRGISPPEIRLVDMYKGVLPFIALEFICLGLIMAFPDLALKLPELLFERVARGTPY